MSEKDTEQGVPEGHPGNHIRRQWVAYAFALRRLLQPEYREILARPWTRLSIAICQLVLHGAGVVIANITEFPPVLEGLAFAGVAGGATVLFAMILGLFMRADAQPSEHDQVLSLLQEIRDRLPEGDG